MRVGDLVKYIGQLTRPYVFSRDPTIQPSGFGVVIEVIDDCEGMCYCIYWPEASMSQWHELDEIFIVNENK